MPNFSGAYDRRYARFDLVDRAVKQNFDHWKSILVKITILTEGKEKPWAQNQQKR